MKFKTILVAIAALFMSAGLVKAESAAETISFAYGDTTRTYTMYLPDTLARNAPLIVYTHGYGSKTRWRADLNEAASRHGFAVCYPDGSPDSRGKDGWMVGYPSQYSMNVNEVEFFKALLDEVCRKYDLSRDNVFMAGMSNGGDLSYQLAFTAPGLFRAYASVAGLLFEWVYLGFKLPEPVPFMEIHGNADKTSMWTGDHDNKGGWGRYIPVPLAASAMAVANRCTTMSTDTLASLRGNSAVVRHTVYSGSPAGYDVELYEIEGGKHSWGHKDVTTSELICRFFKRYVK